MKASEFLISTAAAVTVVGAMGFAYAQTGTPTNPTATDSPKASPTTPATQPPMQSGSGTSGNMNRGSTDPATCLRSVWRAPTATERHASARRFLAG